MRRAMSRCSTGCAGSQVDRGGIFELLQTLAAALGGKIELVIA
jgi:hypothetical protein